MGLTLTIYGTNSGKQWDQQLPMVGLTVANSGTNFWQSMGLTVANQWDKLWKTVRLTLAISGTNFGKLLDLFWQIVGLTFILQYK